MSENRKSRFSKFSFQIARLATLKKKKKTESHANSNLFGCRLTADFGFPQHAHRMAVDECLELLALCCNNGDIYIFGKPGVMFKIENQRDDYIIEDLQFAQGEARLVMLKRSVDNRKVILSCWAFRFIDSHDETRSSLHNEVSSDLGEENYVPSWSLVGHKEVSLSGRVCANSFTSIMCLTRDFIILLSNQDSAYINLFSVSSFSSPTHKNNAAMDPNSTLDCWTLWKDKIAEEYEGVYDGCSRDYVNLPSGQNAIGVYTIPFHTNTVSIIFGHGGMIVVNVESRTTIAVSPPIPDGTLARNVTMNSSYLSTLFSIPHSSYYYNNHFLTRLLVVGLKEERDRSWLIGHINKWSNSESEKWEVTNLWNTAVFEHGYETVSSSSVRLFKCASFNGVRYLICVSDMPNNAGTTPLSSITIVASDEKLGVASHYQTLISSSLLVDATFACFPHSEVAATLDASDDNARLLPDNFHLYLFLLMEKELVTIDLCEPDWPEIELPYLTCINPSSLSVFEFIQQANSDLVSSLIGGGSLTQWPSPLRGGIDLRDGHWGRGSHDLLLSGHVDGSLRIWILHYGNTCYPLLSLYTDQLFQSTSELPYSWTIVAEDDENAHHYRLIGHHEPQKVDPRLSIRRIILANDGTLIACGDAGQCLVWHICSAGESDILTANEERMKIQSVYCHIVTEVEYQWTGFEPLRLRDTSVEEITAKIQLPHLSYMRSPLRLHAVIQILPAANVTSCAFHHTTHTLAVSTAHGFGVIDTLKQNVLLTMSNVNALTDLLNSHIAPVSVKKSGGWNSLRKSLRYRRSKGTSRSTSILKSQVVNQDSHLKGVSGTLTPFTMSASPSSPNTPGFSVWSQDAGASTPDGNENHSKSGKSDISLDMSLRRNVSHKETNDKVKTMETHFSADSGAVQGEPLILGSQDQCKKMIRSVLFTAMGFNQSDKSQKQQSNESKETPIGLLLGTQDGVVQLYSILRGNETQVDEVKLVRSISMKHSAPVICMEFLHGSTSIPIPFYSSLSQNDTAATSTKQSMDPTQCNEPIRLLVITEEQVELMTFPQFKNVTKYKLQTVEDSSLQKKQESEVLIANNSVKAARKIQSAAVQAFRHRNTVFQLTPGNSRNSPHSLRSALSMTQVSGAPIWTVVLILTDGDFICLELPKLRVLYGNFQFAQKDSLGATIFSLVTSVGLANLIFYQTHKSQVSAIDLSSRDPSTFTSNCSLVKTLDNDSFMNKNIAALKLQKQESLTEVMQSASSTSISPETHEDKTKELPDSLIQSVASSKVRKPRPLEKNASVLSNQSVEEELIEPIQAEPTKPHHHYLKHYDAIHEDEDVTDVMESFIIPTTVEKHVCQHGENETPQHVIECQPSVEEVIIEPFQVDTHHYNVVDHPNEVDATNMENMEDCNDTIVPVRSHQHICHHHDHSQPDKNHDLVNPPSNCEQIEIVREQKELPEYFNVPELNKSEVSHILDEIFDETEESLTPRQAKKAFRSQVGRKNKTDAEFLSDNDEPRKSVHDSQHKNGLEEIDYFHKNTEEISPLLDEVQENDDNDISEEEGVEIIEEFVMKNDDPRVVQSKEDVFKKMVDIVVKGGDVRTHVTKRVIANGKIVEDQTTKICYQESDLHLFLACDSANGFH